MTGAAIGYPVIVIGFPPVAVDRRHAAEYGRIRKMPALLLRRSRRAGASFSSSDVYLEKSSKRPGISNSKCWPDEHGTWKSLGSAECSIQRRHQNSLKESPSPKSEQGAAQPHRSQLRVAMKAVGYTNAGTWSS